MTDKEKAIVMAYTGITMLVGDRFDIFHRYIEEKMGRSIWTHELASKTVWAEIKEATREDFNRLCRETSYEAIPFECIEKELERLNDDVKVARYYGGSNADKLEYVRDWLNIKLQDWRREND